MNNDLGDPGAVRILDADNGDVEIVGGAFPVTGIEGIEDGWSDRSYSLPGPASGKNIRIQFEFLSDGDPQTYHGMAIDDVTIGNP